MNDACRRARDGLTALMGSLSRRGTMPAVSVACGVGEQEVFRAWTGDACRRGGTRRAVGEATRYDAASLTKVMATLPAVLRLCAEGVIGLDMPVARLLPELTNPYRARLTVRHLLTHTAGLVPHRAYWRELTGYREIVGAALAEPPAAAPGLTYVYSDLGFVLLGEVLRRAAGRELPELFERVVRRPLALHATGYLPPGADTAATEVEDGRALQGTVHDENARAMGGVAGHAGLFTDLSDAAAYAGAWARLAPELGQADLLREAVRAHPVPGGRRGLGWVAAGDPLWDHVGPSWPATTVSHTGFTGVSLAVDPVRGWWAAVLSNAVHAGRERHGLRGARQALHRAIAAVLTGAGG
jgi:CubicO group peptidase (beta-lactamase class C family)